MTSETPFSRSTPLTTIVGEPSPLILAPIRASMLPNATISGSHEALMIVVRPSARVAAISRFSVPVWLRIKSFSTSLALGRTRLKSTALRRNRTLFNGTRQMNLAKENLKWIRTSMLAETRALKERIEKLEGSE